MSYLPCCQSAIYEILILTIILVIISPKICHFTTKPLSAIIDDVQDCANCAVAYCC